MAEITITQIVAAVAATIGADTSEVEEVQSGELLTESIQNEPVAQVYWESEETDVSGETDRTTFGGVIQQSEVILHIDVYVAQRAHIGQDMARAMVLAEDVRGALVGQRQAKPFFGLEGLKSFRWRAERVTFDYSNVKYAGIRFVLTIRVY